MSDSDITELLGRARGGDAGAASQLYREVYDQLHAMASGHRGRWRGDATLNATALVNEAFLKLAGSRHDDWQNRAHYFAVASRAMRQILVDKARSRCSSKRGANPQHVELDAERDESQDLTPEDAAEILGLHDLLERLLHNAPRQARVIECRFFGGLSIDETAAALEVSATTVRRDWELAKVWLHQNLNEGPA